MSRKYIDCREIHTEAHCSVAISADTAHEVLEAAVQHAVAVHHHYNTPELRQLIKRGIKDGTPAESVHNPVWVGVFRGQPNFMR